jgi:hypothetical protein
MWRDILAIHWSIGLAIMISTIQHRHFKPLLDDEFVRQRRDKKSFLVILFVATMVAALSWPLAAVIYFMRRP